MAIDTYIPTDAKMTIQKEVRQKPSIDERTVIEQPGIVEANNFRPSKKTQSPKKKPQRTKDYTLIITEKPQAAQKIADALGSAIKRQDSGVAYYEIVKGGEKIVVASAVGHLFGLTYSKGEKGWPVFKVEWQPSYKTKSASFTKRYYDLIEDLAKGAKSFIVATDFDIEGEVIGWNVLRFICKQQNAKRMKFSTLTKDELKESYEKALPELNWGNAYAGETRHVLDWLYGINLSRALMSAIKKTGSFKVLSIGRVQGPALKIIVDREREIESFKPVPFWKVAIKVGNTLFYHNIDIFDKQELSKFNNLKDGTAQTKDKEEKVSPPEPFDLTTLQREAYRLHGLSPSNTLKIAQQLYLDGLISYPRTSSQKIPESIKPKEILKMLSGAFKEVSHAKRQKPVEGKKSDPAHPSIYPTGEYASLTGQEEKLYNLIVKRFISAFCEDAIVAHKKVTITANDLDFSASCNKVISKGWSAVYPYKKDDEDLEDLNGDVKIDETKIEEHQTQPPKRFTPTSLISLLEKKNLGTKATRSSIVDTLFDRGYLDGQSIKATNLGLQLISALEKYSPVIIDENLTREIEDEIEQFQESSAGLEEKEKGIIKKAESTIKKIAETFQPKEQEIGAELLSGLQQQREAEREANLLNQCPRCKKGNLRITYSKKTKRYFISCSSYPECTQTYTLPPNALIKKSDKKCESCGFDKVLAIRKAKRPWELCFNSECTLVKQQRAEWEAKKANWAAKREEKQ
ncbi:MAG TPA: DNA topoisomerase I [Candidatus Nanoarchaeia archaeon]|nr:DNA topoisomerase I [Candidatus Nanoarchaeia archaeon]